MLSFFEHELTVFSIFSIFFLLDLFSNVVNVATAFFFILILSDFANFAAILFGDNLHEDFLFSAGKTFLGVMSKLFPKAVLSEFLVWRVLVARPLAISGVPALALAAFLIGVIKIFVGVIGQNPDRKSVV